MNKTKPTGEITGKINADPNPLFFGRRCVISWETNDPTGAEIRVSTAPDDEKLVSKSRGRSGQTEIPWIVDSTVYDFRLYAASQPDKPIDSVRVKRDFESVPLILHELADEALRGNIGMAELSLFIAALIPAYLQTERFRQVFPVLLQQLAVDVMHGNVGANEVSQFIATVIPKYLDKSIAGKIVAAPNPISFGENSVRIAWGINDPAGGEVRVSTSPGDEMLLSRGPSGQMEIPWISDSTKYEFRLYAASQPTAPVDSVEVRRDLDSAPIILRTLAEEAGRGNIDMVELSRFIVALIPVYLQTDRFSQVFPTLLLEFAINALRGNVGATELSNFIAITVPKFTNNSVAGKIVATPNPLSFGEDHVLISWGTNDPAGGEVRVLTSSGEEKLLTREPSGQMKVPWISHATKYDFRLYAASKPDAPIDSVRVLRDLDSERAILGKLADKLTRETIDTMELSKFIATVIPRCLHSGKFQEIFPLWERHGFHVTPVHFYQPIPDTQSLPDTLWTQRSKLVGINMNASVQLDLLRNHFPKFRDEYEQFPTTPTEEPGHFYLNNHLFDGADALVAYCMTRHFRPQLLIEVGSGFSSLLLGQAATKNNNSTLICIEPFAQEFLKHGFRGLHSLIEKKVQDMDLDFFSQLGPGDVLFIDSSHTVKIGGDVNYLFLEVLPRLKPGVIVHVHDIFFPFDYRRDWVKEEFRFWTEQYLLQAFLAFNSEFEVLMANRYLAHKYSEDLKAAFPSLGKLKANSKESISWGGGSFWMRRKT